VGAQPERTKRVDTIDGLREGLGSGQIMDHDLTINRFPLQQGTLL
jgi:hypothetical protein